jgi:hypothetical protein
VSTVIDQSLLARVLKPLLLKLGSDPEMAAPDVRKSGMLHYIFHTAALITFPFSRHSHLNLGSSAMLLIGIECKWSMVNVLLGTLHDTSTAGHVHAMTL